MSSVNTTIDGPKYGKNNLETESTLNVSSETMVIENKNTSVVVIDDKLGTVDSNKMKNNSVNLDDVNLMTRTTVSIAEAKDEDDGVLTKRSNKPVNYAARKTAAQGMMDIALLTSNANQLKNLMEFQRTSNTYWFVFILIVSSLILQIYVGVSLIFMGRFDSKSKNKAAAARVNMFLMSSVFLITIINVFIAAFSTGSVQNNP